MEKVMSNNFEPGAAQFGNFIDYYKFNPSDKRIELLPYDFWELLKCNDSCVTCLDVGCNSGELTSVLHGKLSSVVNAEGTKTFKFIGVDLDQVLIERANKSFQNNFISFICSDVTEDCFENILLNILKENSCEAFHVICMFSITMWIHLNSGDEGLKKVLKLLSKLTKFLILEAQPWKCYKTALRRMRKYKMNHFPAFCNLKMRESVEDDIDKYLIVDCGMSMIYQSPPSHWGRKIKLFTQRTDVLS